MDTENVNVGHKSVLSKKRYPVITIVLYFNDERGWNYPKNIKGCFNPPLPDNDVMNRLDEFISDYQITVFDIGEMSLEEAAVFKSDFREVAEYFIKMRRGENYVPSSRTITHVDEFLKLMSTLTGDRDYEKIIEKINNDDKEETTVCKVLQGAMNEGRREGYKGEANSVITIIEGFAPNKGITIENVMTMLNVSVEQYNKYKLAL